MVGWKRPVLMSWAVRDQVFDSGSYTSAVRV